MLASSIVVFSGHNNCEHVHNTCGIVQQKKSCALDSFTISSVLDAKWSHTYFKDSPKFTFALNMKFLNPRGSYFSLECDIKSLLSNGCHFVIYSLMSASMVIIAIPIQVTTHKI